MNRLISWDYKSPALRDELVGNSSGSQIHLVKWILYSDIDYVHLRSYCAEIQGAARNLLCLSMALFKGHRKKYSAIQECLYIKFKKVFMVY